MPEDMFLHGMVQFLVTRNHRSVKVHFVNVLNFGTLYSMPFWPKFWQLFLKILSEMTSSIDHDQTAPSGGV